MCFVFLTALFCGGNYSGKESWAKIFACAESGPDLQGCLQDVSQGETCGCFCKLVDF